MSKNGYLQKQKLTIDAYRQAEKDTYIQFMTDTISIVLNDPEVMGKDVFGKKRLRRIIDAWGKVYDQYFPALQISDEADYYQEKLDKRIEAIIGKDDLIPFSTRYPWIKLRGYEPRRK